MNSVEYLRKAIFPSRESMKEPKAEVEGWRNVSHTAGGAPQAEKMR